MIELWEPLAEPPFHEARWFDCQKFEVIDHFLVGTTIYVLALTLIDFHDYYYYYYYSYNVNEGNWKFLRKSEVELPSRTTSGLCVLESLCLHTRTSIFIYIYDCRVYASLIPSNYDKDMSSVTRYQALNEV